MGSRSHRIALSVLLLHLLFATAAATSAEELSGRVVGVIDGDTIDLLATGDHVIRVRLSEIDAPERSQSWGKKSKQHLSSLCFGKQATVDNRGMDRYQRVIGRVWCSGRDANSAQVEAGMAWVYRQYAKDPELFALEAKAKQMGLGLWGDRNPVPPWEWRRK